MWLRSAPRIVRAKTCGFEKKKREREKKEITALPGIGCVTRSASITRLDYRTRARAFIAEVD